MNKKPVKRRPKNHKKQFKSKPKFRSGDTVSWIPDKDIYKVLEVTDKIECGIQILKIKALNSGTEFYVHEDALYHSRYSENKLDRNSH